MQLKDHYKTLGVKPNAVHADIKKAYRVLAVRYHPDKNPGSELCEAQFKEVGEAYGVLSDTRKRAKYDDDRWLSGIGGRTSYEEAVTPAWLHKVCVELNISLAKMDTHRMNQGTLQAYMMLILTDAHIGVLHTEGDRTVNNAIVAELLRASEWLNHRYLATVLDGLKLLAGADKELRVQISEYGVRREQTARRERLFPYVVIAVTLALCVFMYLYASVA